MEHIDVAITGFGSIGKHVARPQAARQQRYRERYGGLTRAGVELTLYDDQHPFARVHGRTKATHVIIDEIGAHDD